MMTIRLASIAAGLILVAGMASAQPPLAEPVSIDIPALPLNDALKQLARQAGFQVVFYSRESEGVNTRSLSGKFTAEQALSELLTGTALTYEFVNTNTVAIRPKADGGRPVAGERDENAQVLQLAQTQPADAVAQSGRGSQAEQTPQRPAEKSPNDKPIEEIIVTAQKRAERLQDVPISISVLSGGDLDKSTAQGITEALDRVPGVATMLGHQGGGTLVAVRGVSAGAILFNGSSPIAYYLDSVPFGLVKSAVAPDPNAYDMERVEVLRGPQSTLYGASAQNGVVRVLSKDADLDRFEFKVRTALSSTRDAAGGNSRADAALNVPLVEGKLAARAVVGYQNLSGWIDKPNDKDANDADLRTFRLKVNAQPSENLSIGASAWLARDDFGAPSLGFDRGHSTGVAPEPIATDYSAYGLKIGYEFSGFSLSSMTSYLDYSNDSATDYTPLVPNNILVTGVYSRIFAQEINLSSKREGPWRWSAGGIYRDGKDRLFQDREGYVAYTDLRDYSESAAIFGQLTRLFLDGRFELSGGLRYFEDDVTNREFARTSGVPANQLITDSDRFHKISPRVALTWHPQAEMTVYASYAEGFRSGFPQNGNILATAPQFESLRADNLRNYELGAKGSLWGGRVSFDMAAFYIHWTDVQQTISVNVGTVASPINLAALINGKSASGPGFEMALTTEPVKGLELGVNFSWNDLTMDSDVRSAGPGAPPEGFLLYNKGDRLNLSSEYTAGASVGYAFPLGGKGYVGHLAASANYNSAQQYRTILGGVSLSESDNILISRASFAIDAPNHWSASLFVDNLNDESGSPLITPFRAPTWNLQLRPRTVGVQFDYRY